MTKTILLTGATDGIGLALAQQYRQTNARLVLVGRRSLADLSDDLFTGDTYCQADLADANCTAQISAWLHERGITAIDLVIHNAASGYVGTIWDQDAQNIRQLVQVNLWTPVALSHLLYPLVERAEGKIAFVSSVAAALPGPDYAVYTATKAALEGFVRSWRIELAADGSPVQLQILRPGATRTNMHAKSGAQFSSDRVARFAAPTRVATAMRHTLAGTQEAVTFGLFNKLLRGAGSHCEGWIEGLMRVGKKRGRASAAQAAPVATAGHCVITGAADGIGRALAHSFARAGYIVTGIDVDGERAEKVAAELADHGDVQFILADLADEEALTTLGTQLAERPPITVFIHNAGISAVGPFIASNLARQRAVLAINLLAPLLLTAQLLQQNRLAHGATVVLISSLSRFLSYPGAAVYAATKDGLATYGSALAVALAPQQQRVLTVYPGPTRTAHARRYSPDNRHEERRMLPATLAAQILRAVATNRRTLIPGFANRVAAAMGRHWPLVGDQLMRRTIYNRMRTVPQFHKGSINS